MKNALLRRGYGVGISETGENAIELAREKEKQNAQAVAGAEAASDSARIYLICDQGDLEAIGPLSAFLYDKGLDPILPVFEGDPAEVRQANEEELRLCDAVLVYHGSGNDLWLRKKLSEMQKIVGDGRTKPFRAKPCIYVGAPETPQKRLYRNRDAMVISQLESLDPDSLAPFVAALGAKTS